MAKKELSDQPPLTDAQTRKRIANQHLDVVLKKAREGYEHATVIKHVPLTTPGVDGLLSNLLYIRKQLLLAVDEIDVLREKIDAGKLRESDFRP